MRRSMVIATCLVNSSMCSRIEDAESRVLGVFEDEFPRADFGRWNEDVNDVQLYRTHGLFGSA